MVTKGHHDSPKVTAHVQELLQAFPTLRPKYDYYSHLSGQREPMLCTYGTLPVNYRGQTYHIPVALWFPVRYPECPPLVRVEPTANMAVIPGKCVNSAGQVHHPYLSQWATQPAAAQSLIELLRALQVAFGNESPVGMKPATPNQAQHHHHSLPADAPRPPPVSEQRPLHQTMPAQVTPNDIQHTMSAPGQIEDTAHESMASPPPNLETT
ncbi:suppressor protein stp22 of temperature-sensitive alpha-factor receptor and arginine permease, partial [Dimargaris xerosporica]